ncbi:MAG TPA: alpha-galactosidase [Bryobacteraceae bacterium]|nr:alpha-galactosidase [Bryobacteraceae bacterium]
MNIRLAVPVLLSLFPLAGSAEIRYVAARKLWHLQAGPVSYVIGVNEKNELQSMYWGKRLWRDDDLQAAHSNPEWASFDNSGNTTPQEYPGWGGGRYIEPCLKVTLPDGVRDLVLHYVSYTIDGNTLRIELKDIGYDLGVTLRYQVFPETGVIRKSALIRNGTRQPLTLESAQSGAWNLPRGEGYRLTYLSGRWAGEWQINREPVHPGMKVIESRRGSTSHQANPWFAIDEGQADEGHGRVWFGALGWSGNWRLSIEQTAHQQVRVTGGFNPFDFSYPLAPGQTLETPPFYAGFTDGGFGEASRILHRFERTEIMPGGVSARPRPVLYNSWEATEFAVNEEGQKALAAKAAKLGVERFVMDDGWFGARNNDHAGLGDWTVNRQKFPHGLGPLIDYVNSLGMDFGLWVEPEMVNPDSNLYRQHPDWAMHFPDRPRTEARNQLVLNMARDDVKNYIFEALDRLLVENPKIAFLKWDMNRNFSEPGWPEAPVAQQKELWVAYTRNVYDIMDRLRRKHPKLEIESCSGGGGRVDLGILSRTDEVWTSDNTDAFDRLRIQEGFSYAYTPKAMMAWVTDVPNFNGRSTPLQYRFLVAMMGSLGIGGNLNKWTDNDMALATRMVELYKSIRTTVQQGKLYRLFSPGAGTFSANEYVSEDGRQAVLFAFRSAQDFGYPPPVVRLSGLDGNAVYRVKTIDRKLAGSLDTVSGDFLMNRGIDLRLGGDFDSTLITFERVP